MGKLTAIDFKLHKSKRPQDQIADFLREEIHSGHLKPGEKLPPNLKLAAQWHTHENTIQRAMVPLVKEGLLLRIPRVGTYIREREEKLTCVGVYSGTSVKDAPFSHAVNEALMDELHRAGIQMDLWIDSRPRDQRHEAWEPLVKAAEQRRFQAFIATEVTRPLVHWQQKLPVPVAFLGAESSVPNNVGHDPVQFVDITLRELKRQGCRSVGFIAPILRADAPHLIFLEMLAHFTALASDLGLAVRNDWMRLVAPAPSGTQGQERFGYEEFLKLWNQQEKPDGLIVHLDTVSRGVVVALREKQVRVPKDLKLVLHKNESIDLFCPMPATFVVSSERELARALIGQIQKQFRGETCEKICPPCRLMAHPGIS